MAASPLNPESHIHSCSNSLPSKPHPLILQCNEHLCRLESSSASTTSSSSSSSSSSFSHKLSGLQDLHDCVEKLVQLPITRQVLVRENRVDELLDGSLRLLDVCTAAKDSLLHTKECAREVQSIMRRKRAGEMEVTAEVRKYLTSRKVMKKAIFKALKGASNRCKFLSSPTNKCHQTEELIIKVLKDVEVVSISLLESLLKFISGPTESKSGNWSLISKLMHKKKVACTQETEAANEFSKVDAALQCFVFEAASKSEFNNVNHLQNQLEDLQSVVQDFVEVLETLFRRFIKIRVSILNILNH